MVNKGEAAPNQDRRKHSWVIGGRNLRVRTGEL